MPVPEVLRRLLTAPGPSGYEQAAAAVFRDACAPFADVSHDTVGSTVARVKGTADGPLLAVIGHIDEIGLIVHHIDDDGFLWFSGVGGWDPVILVGQRVEIATRDGAVPGVVGKKPIHLLREDDRKQVPELRQLHIDIGAKDGDDARSLVRVGDVAIVVDVTFATDQPGVDEKELGGHKFGSGPVIGRGSTLDPQVFELLHAAGEEAGIPFTVAASARYTGTDADAIHLSRA